MLYLSERLSIVLAGSLVKCRRFLRHLLRKGFFCLVLFPNNFLELITLTFCQNQAQVLVFLSFLYNPLLDVVIKGWSSGTIHPVVASHFIVHALVKVFLLINTVTTALPVGGPSHLHQTAVVKCAANVLTSVHSHVLHTKRVRS